MKVISVQEYRWHRVSAARVGCGQAVLIDFFHILLQAKQRQARQRLSSIGGVFGIGAIRSGGVDGVSRRAGGEEKAREAVANEQRRQAECVKEIFGNPFRPVRMEEGWGTAEVMAIANEIYKAEAFVRVGELAAALKWAGCGDKNILAHLRNPSGHVRGCWAVDLVLRKDWMGRPQ